MLMGVDVCSCALLKCVPKTCLMVRSNQPPKLANSECLHNKIELLASFTYAKKNPKKPVPVVLTYLNRFTENLL